MEHRPLMTARQRRQVASNRKTRKQVRKSKRWLSNQPASPKKG